MEVGSLLISLAIVVLVAAFVARPLFDRQAQQVSESERRLSALQAERDRVLSLLQDLEMDFATGKITQVDFQAQRAPLVVQGANVLRQLDRLAPAAVGGPAAGGSLEDQLEREIACRRSSAAPAVGYCAVCGTALRSGDRFCTRCGTAVPAKASA